MKTLFLFIGNRAFASDLLHTKYIGYLADKYRVVVFLADDGGARDLGSYPKSPNIEYKLIPEPRGRFWMIFNDFLRAELIKKYNDNPSVKWRNAKVSDPKRLFLRYIAKVVPQKFFSVDFFTYIETFLVPNYRDFKKNVEKYKPSLVLLNTPGLPLLEVYGVLSAKRAGIPTVAMNFSWDNLSAYPRNIRKTDYLICWNKLVVKEAKEVFGYKDDEVFLSGISRFDHYFNEMIGETDRDAFLNSKGLDPKKKTLFYAGKGHGTFPNDFIEHFLKWQKEGALPQMNLFVRAHPIDSITKYSSAVGAPNTHLEYAGGRLVIGDTQKGQKVEMDEADRLNMKMTIKHCDLCLNISSTVSIEAMIFDKPVVNIGFVPRFSEILGFNHYRPIVELGGSRVANSFEEVRKLIELYINNPETDRDNRAEVIDLLVSPTDGDSYKRSVDFIEEIINK